MCDPLGMAMNMATHYWLTGSLQIFKRVIFSGMGFDLMADQPANPRYVPPWKKVTSKKGPMLGNLAITIGG